MRRATAIRLVLAVATVLGLVVSGPAMSATGPGTIRVTSPVTRTILGDEALITWTYTYGTLLKTSSIIAISASKDGGRTWKALATWLPVRSAFVWDTTGFDSGSYTIQVWARGTNVVSRVSNLIIDHVPPTVSIVRPAEGDVAGITTTNVTDTIVTGPTTLEATATDGLAGVADVVWMIDDEIVASGATAVYNFDQKYGRHMLTAIATDRAGNVATDTRFVTAVPGPTAALQNLGLLPSDPPSQSPAPSPSPSPGSPLQSVPTLPVTVPDVPALPELD